MDPTTLSHLVHEAALDLVAVAAVESGRLVFANEAFHRLFGLSPRAGEVERALVSLVSQGERGDPLEEVALALERSGGDATRLDFRGTRADGTAVDVDFTGRRVELGHADAFVAVASDITQARRSQEQLDRIASRDPLTGLPNRTLFTDRLLQALLASARSDDSFAVMVADLDGFKQVNDTHGHATGDALLRVVARRIKSCVRTTDTVARLGGDEFAIVLPHVRGRDDASTVAARIVAAVSDPIVLGSVRCNVGASVGIAIYPDSGADSDSLLESADAAMYCAKRGGKNRFEVAPAVSAGLAASSCELLDWGPSHEVGIRAIDSQHSKLSKKLNRLADGLKAGVGIARITELLDDVTAWTRLHFRTEERLMSSFDYPELGAHAREHRALLDDLETFGVQDEAHVAATMARLSDWFLGHIEDSDRPMAEWITRDRRERPASHRPRRS